MSHEEARNKMLDVLAGMIYGQKYPDLLQAAGVPCEGRPEESAVEMALWELARVTIGEATRAVEALKRPTEVDASLAALKPENQ